MKTMRDANKWAMTPRGVEVRHSLAAACRYIAVVLLIVALQTVDQWNDRRFELEINGELDSIHKAMESEVEQKTADRFYGHEGRAIELRLDRVELAVGLAAGGGE